MAQSSEKRTEMPSYNQLRELSPPAQAAYAARCALRVLILTEHPAADTLQKALMCLIVYSTGGLSREDLSLIETTTIESSRSTDSKNASAVEYAIINTIHGKIPLETAQAALDAAESILNSGRLIDELHSDYADLIGYTSSKFDRPVDSSFYLNPLWRHLEDTEFEVIEKQISQWIDHIDRENREKFHRRYRAFLDTGRYSVKIDWKEIEEEVRHWLAELQENQAASLKTGEAPEQETETGTPESELNIEGAPSSLGSRLSDTDLLGHQHLVDSIAAMIASPKQDTPFTIGLLGDWGSGKSNVLHLLRKSLIEREDSDRFYFADFNAWQYEHTDNMAAGVAQEVIKGLLDKKNFWQQTGIRLRFGNKENGWLVPLIVVLLLVVAVYSFVMILLDGSRGWIAALGASGIILTGFIKRIFTILEHPLTAKINSYLKLPSYVDHLGTIPMLQRHLRFLCELIIPSGGEIPSRLVVFVDDLDRCEPEAISRTLDAIRLVMDIENVVVIIGIDHRIAFRAVEKQYQDLADDKRTSSDIARDYLGKIIQLPITLNKPRKEELEKFISVALFSDADQTIPENNTRSSESHKIENLPENAEPVDSENGHREISQTENSETAETPELPQSGIQDSQPSESDTIPDERDEPVDVDMTETDEEKEAFSELCFLFDLHNPRQLIRLRNCYRLLKRMSRQQSDWHEKMTQLFWLEFVYARQQNKRLSIKESIRNKNMDQIQAFIEEENLNPELFEILSERLDLQNGDFSQYMQLDSVVKRLVLPHSESPQRAKKEEQSEKYNSKDV